MVVLMEHGPPSKLLAEKKKIDGWSEKNEA